MTWEQLAEDLAAGRAKVKRGIWHIVECGGVCCLFSVEVEL